MLYLFRCTVLEKKEAVVAIAAVMLVLYTATLATLEPVISATVSSRKVTNNGALKAVGVGIYSDAACTNSMSSIDWGALDPGSSTDRTVYIRNEGNAASVLSLSTSNWNPSGASNYITLSWNYNSQSVAVQQVVTVKLTLAISQSITGITNFSFDATVTATG